MPPGHHLDVPAGKEVGIKRWDQRAATLMYPVYEIHK